MQTVLFHAREAGVANMMFALEEPLQRQGYNIIYDVDDCASEILVNQTSGSIEDSDIVICGYDSVYLDRTGEFLKRVNGRVPSMGLMDSWNGLKRFWKDDGSLRLLTDILIVPDYEVKQYLLSKGLPSEFPVVAGHPGLEQMNSYTSEERLKLREKVRSTLGFDLEDKVALLLSEELHLPDGSQLSLVNAKVKGGKFIYQWLDCNVGDEYKIAVRLHPVEKKVIPNGWIDACNIELSMALAMADKVYGVGSTAIAYAIAFGFNVHYLNSTIEKWSPEYSDIPSELWDDLISSGVFQNHSKAGLINDSYCNSADKIIGEINKMLTLV